MFPRKVVLWLAILVISALTLFVISLLDADAIGAPDVAGRDLPAVPDTLLFYREALFLGPDGTATVEVAAVPAKGGFGDLLLPFAFSDGVDFRILSGPVSFAGNEGGPGSPTRRVLGSRMLDLRWTGDPAPGDTIVVRSDLPGWFDRAKARKAYGEFALSRSFVNTSEYVLRDFELATVLPEGMLVHSVTRVEPEYDSKKNPEPPFRVGRDADRGWASLHRSDLVPAGTARLDLNFRPAKRGSLPLIVGIALALLYLAFFRDVLRPGKE